MLQVRDLSIEVGGRLVLEAASFRLQPGDKVGLVGRNGAGKTSLLKVLAGEGQSIAGEVRRRGNLGYLPQDPRIRRAEPSLTALAHILSARGLDDAPVRLEKLRLAIEESPTLRNVSRFSQAEQDFRDAGGYSADAAARQIAVGLGLPAERLDLPVAVLSGGERRRAELARILFGGVDVLLLDEPTNHLDSDAKGWLMKFLAGYRGALMVVSHDLALLDRSITRVLHLDDRQLVEYRGTYTQYREARTQDEQRQAKVAVRQEAEIRRLKALADSMRHGTEKRARIAHTLDSRVSRLQSQAVSAPKHERRIRVRFPEPPHSGNVMVVAEGLAKSYGGPPVFEDAGFDLGRGERLLVMGLNGAGKTSLLRILAGETSGDSGRVRLGTGVSLGYYAQEHEGIVAGVPVIEHMRAHSFAPDEDLRRLMGMFRLTGEIAFQDAGTLSGGEKTKLALAQLVAGRHNLLLLDEPTNNLDPPSREAVGRALATWPGSMIVVSHDEAFVRELTPDRVLEMPEATLDFWSDDLLDVVSLA
ncbi:MAG TPA: ABC-F family ATP-binding cassette domain-containing protein [Actinomycetota bacterium]|nr:ABC-F family ATP-binding cassette domain-containing protein [Actinomycetota bacterium]